MAQDFLSKLNPLDDEFWSDNPEEKFKQIIKFGYAGIGLSFFSLILVLIESEAFEVLVSGMLFSTCPPYWVAMSDLCWEFGLYNFFWPIFGILFVPIVTGTFLINVFGRKSILPKDKILAGFFIFLFAKDFLIFLMEIGYYLSLIEIGFSYIIVFIAELCALIVIGALLVSVFQPKLFSDKIIIYSLISTSTILFLFTLYHLVKFAYNPLDNLVYFLYVISLPISYGLFSYSMACLYSYRANVEPWGEEKITSSDSSSAPEPQSPSSMSTESIAKIKSLSELRDSGVFSDDEFEEQKAKIMSETNSSSTYVGSGEPIDDTFRILMYVVSFLIPIVGIVVGILYTMKPDDHSQEFGKMCLKIAIASIAIGFILGILFTLVIFSAY